MNRIANRAGALFLLVILLLGGMGFFLYEYACYADSWVISTGSPHVYNSTNIVCGQVVDRDGNILLDITASRTYAEDLEVRKSTLHWLGDREGRISAPAVSHYAKEMTGYNPITGLYSYSGSGGQAVLTLSADIQETALKAMDGRKGTIAVYNYKTGEILCAVTTPNYDPDDVPDIANDDSDKWEGVYLNRFTQSSYVPGSIFKVVTTAAALDAIPDILDQRFKCTGHYEYGAYDVTCEKAHGELSLKTALQRSCNCSFAQIANQLGASTLEEYVKQFQVTEPVSFDGITTAKGNYDLEGSSKVQVAWSAIGQHTDLINPCRYMTFMGMIAGGGQAAMPHLVSSVTCDEEVNYEAETKLSDRVMSEEIASILREYMRNNVENNYGAKNFPGLKVCAKSGTSQLGGDQQPNAMFAGFVDDEAYPLAFMVVVENGGYGSSTCVPILSKVLAACKAELDAA